MGKVEVWIRVDKNGEIPGQSYSPNIYIQRVRYLRDNGQHTYTEGSEKNYHYPCWNLNFSGRSYKYNLCKNIKEAVKAMKAYDEENGYYSMKIGEYYE